jgi:hypothetical protein
MSRNFLLVVPTRGTLGLTQSCAIWLKSRSKHIKLIKEITGRNKRPMNDDDFKSLHRLKYEEYKAKIETDNSQYFQVCRYKAKLFWLPIIHVFQ